MAEKLAKVTGAQNEVPPSSAIEIAGAMAEAIAATTAAAGISEHAVFDLVRSPAPCFTPILSRAKPFGTTA